MQDHNAILDVSLTEFLRPAIALSLQHVLKLYTVAHLLEAWNTPREQRRIEQIFDTPQQARHAVSVCAAWLGFETYTMHGSATARAPDPWAAGDVGIQLTPAPRADYDA